MVSGHHIRLIQVSNFLDLNIYAKTPWGPRVSGKDASGSGKDAFGSGKDASGSGKDASGSGKDASGSGKDALNF